MFILGIQDTYDDDEDYYYYYENNNFKRNCLRICILDPTIYLWPDTR